MDGQDLQQCYKGRWDDLFDKTNTCLKKIIPIAAAKLRNYILDQVGRPRRLCPFFVNSLFQRSLCYFYLNVLYFAGTDYFSVIHHLS
mgnify:CR=1 FL=1